VDKAALASVSVIAETHPDPIGTIAIPMRDHVSAETFTSMQMTDWRFIGDRSVNKLLIQGSILTLQRNEAVQRMRGDWQLFIDDDMAFGPGAIANIVSTYHELKEQVHEPLIVGGLCVRRYEPYQPTAYMRDTPTSGPFNYLEDWTDDIVEVDATGSAFVLIEVPVFEAIMGGPLPSEKERAGLPPWEFYEWVDGMGEDLRFCMKAKEAGARIFIDTRLRIGHVSSKVVDIRDFWHQVLLRPPEIYEARKGANDAMGLPTMSPERALERLQP
jgi:hypothetical protein